MYSICKLYNLGMGRGRFRFSFLLVQIFIGSGIFFFVAIQVFAMSVYQMKIIITVNTNISYIGGCKFHRFTCSRS